MRSFVPMSPILSDEIPAGEDWVYQLKWDGFRIIAYVDNGKVELYSKQMLRQNDKYPEVVDALSRLKGHFIFDGEAVIMDADTNRPSFQKMQQRNKLSEPALIKKASQRQPVQYIVFDLLQYGGRTLCENTFKERNRQLQMIDLGNGTVCYLTDLFEDSETLWNWAAANGWEGIISKRLSSIYREGKDHRDWFKRKTVLHMDVDVVGFIMKADKLSSLIMSKNGVYAGRVSSGLNGRLKSELLRLQTGKLLSDYFEELPDGLKGGFISLVWLHDPLPCRVKMAEVTEAGLLRQPQLLAIEGKPL